jgi:hypothetical protein
MKKGDGLIQANVSGDSLIHMAAASLDGVFPSNELVGATFDGVTGLPISKATVFCEETGHFASTDSLGEFIIQLNTLKSVTLNSWHPLYDSIRFVVNKDYIRTPKRIEICFQSQRRTADGETINYRDGSTVLLLVDVMQWSSWVMQPHEFSNRIYTYAVLPGEVFGPTSDWPFHDCIPFRLVRELPDSTAWIQFSRQFKLITAGMGSNTNYVFLSDTTAKLNTRSLDGGTTVALSLQPDYSPRGTINKTDYSSQRNRVTKSEKNKVDSCETFRAQVERTHINNLLALLEGDFTKFASSFSKSYNHPENKQNLPLEEFFRILSEGKLPGKYAGKRLLEIFNLNFEEMFVHAICPEPANERFLNYCDQRKFVPQDGDVFIYWPEASGGWSGGLSAIYRSEDGTWKIVAIF